MNQDILELKLKGYCCSQIIMALGLKKLGKENSDLIDSMAGLCNGIWRGDICGILSAGVCLLYLADKEEAAKHEANDLIDWFEGMFSCIKCDDLLEGNPLNKSEKCPVMLDATFNRICEVLDWE